MIIFLIYIIPLKVPKNQYKPSISNLITLIISLCYHNPILAQAQSTVAHHKLGSHFDILTTGLLIVFFGVVLSLLVCTYLNCFPRSSLPYRVRRAHQQAQSGLDPSIIEAFHVFMYNHESGLGLEKGPLECSVCLSLFKDGEKLCVMPKCEHVFHLECVNKWLAGHTTCPFCRAELAARPIELPGCANEVNRGVSRVEMGDVANGIV